MTDDRRRIEIRITGQAVHEGRVPVSLLTGKLEHTQAALLQLALARADQTRDISHGGRVPELVQRQCELFLVETRRGSFSATLELPPLEPALFEGLPDLGETSLGDLKTALESIVRNDPEPIAQVLPDPGVRRTVLRTISAILPRRGADYCVEIAVGGSSPISGATRPNRDELRRLAQLPEEPTRPTQAELKLIRATCWARVDDSGSPRIDRVVDYEVIDDSHQYRPTEIEWRGRHVRLKHEIACGVSREDGLWLVEYEPLGIYAYAETREQAIQDFAEEFVAIWEHYAEVPDGQLTRDAIDLKEKLLALVAEVTHGE